MRVRRRRRGPSPPRSFGGTGKLVQPCLSANTLLLRASAAHGLGFNGIGLWHKRAAKAMRLCHDDDGGYLRWLTSHTDGFIVNTYRNPKTSYLRLHRATCPTIQGRPANGARWTATYIKVCGSKSELESWAKDVVGGDLWPCPRCV